MAERKRQRIRSDIPKGVMPELTAVTALEFVKLLHAGLPADHALAYMAPDYYATIGEPARKTLVGRWLSSRIVLAATEQLHEGKWAKLPLAKREEIALDKTFGQLAYYLYTHDYATLEGPDLKKANDARVALMEKLKATDVEGDETPMQRLMRDILSGNAQLGMPLQLGPAGPPKSPVRKPKAGES